jgi:succinate dehydrogenase/fumarate reductase flavoprotein subunit
MPTATPTTTIRVATTTRTALRELAQASGESMQQVLDQALELYRRQQVLEQTNAAYAALRADPAAWAAVEAERRAWNATLNDGLEEV